MVFLIDSLRFTGIDCPIDCDNKILPSCISQNGLQIAGEPNLDLFTVFFVIYRVSNAVERGQ